MPPLRRILMSLILENTGPARDEMKNIVATKLKLFGSAGKA